MVCHSVGLAVLILSNKPFFVEKQAYTLNLLFKEYDLGEITNWMLFISCFVVGIVISYLFSYPVRMKLRREIKRLNATANSHLEMIASLKKELEGFKGSTGDTSAGTMETSSQSSEKNDKGTENQPRENA
ncbi:TPA: LapA family protein [Candidatus Micrarchaeota archaeon]|nr:LapA family protein [Candidatus Micrarchaeota archaeon]